MSNKRNDRKATRRAEAEARNSIANAHRAKCGHIHGEGVGCQGRVFTHPATNVLHAIFGEVPA